MGVEHYAFALFVTAMICVVAVLFKLLFADVRRQKKLLDEKESELLAIYRTVENIMEEFADHVKAVMEEIQKHEDRLAELAANPSPHLVVSSQSSPAWSADDSSESVNMSLLEKLPRSMTVEASAYKENRIRAAGEVIERAGKVIKNDKAKSSGVNGASENSPAFQRFLDDSLSKAQTVNPVTAAKQKRNETILALAKQGKTITQIAEELSITQNEVKLIIKILHCAQNDMI